ncbi:uncharacterized protein KY384_001527 [Bacidia gigantensis]|uniref:uncharacterized protein n=1 Tax=Bacidia gigantensis TaxID=2732470 RepID=UPI001D0505CD|nr:uncharacterized protein KY384_001527 [Bacidia gigantensis]KAG8533786.1 hypothetical protein KY384_001527 [Bacidia gigantensis]
MRIGIREQLAILVLLSSLIALAVVATATWITSHNFVLHIRSSALSLTASLYADQLNSNLFLLLSNVHGTSTRVVLQNSLQRYNDQNNNTDANWVRARQDLQSALSGGGVTANLLQARIVSKNGTGSAGPYGLLNVTNPDVLGTIPLPSTNPQAPMAYLGDNGTGYPPELYPELTFNSTVRNATFNESIGFFAGNRLYADAKIFLGPRLLNETFGMMSITVPMINNTSSEDTLGWLTVVVSARSILQIDNSTKGLGDTGQILIVAPDTPDQRLPSNIRDNNDDAERKDLAQTQQVKYVTPPTQNSSRSTRHPLRAFGSNNAAFKMAAYPAILKAYSNGKELANSGGSLLKSHNEEKKQISVGYAQSMSTLVDWALIIEQSHGEVLAPINRLRNVLIACVFGTLAGVLILLFPVAHFSVRPIRRLRAATKKTVEPELFSSDGGSFRSFSSHGIQEPDSGEDEQIQEVAKKEGFLGRVASWRVRRQDGDTKAKKRKRSNIFRIPGKVEDHEHIIHDELTDLTRTFNEMSEELTMQYARLEERVKERTQELEISKKAAEVANESKTLFIANISHELKTPLNGILGMCAVSMQEDDPAKIKRSLGIIYKSGDLLLHLLTDLLTFTKNQMGQQLTLDEREFRLADVTSQILSIFDKQSKEGQITLRLAYLGPSDIGENTPAASMQSGFGPYGTGRIKDMFIWGDQHRILQIIINLVSNSLKFTPPNGTVDVRIKCLGDAPEIAESRKDSMTSKLSKRQSSKGSKRGFTRRMLSSSASSTSAIPREREDSRYSDTALHINAKEPKSAASFIAGERSSSPLPLNARQLLFEFEVQDTGPGIPLSQQQKVFEPFMQGDLGLSKKYAGTGLGLSICSQLATLMRGSIHLESEVGKGSRFTVRVPLAFTKERADSTASSNGTDSRPNSVCLDSAENAPITRRRSSSDMSAVSTASVPPALNAVNSLDTPAKPRLVGLSQPYFASTSPMEDPDKQLAAMERVAAQAVQCGRRVSVLVAEDNVVNQEVVLKMLKLEDIYDIKVAKDGQEAYDLVKAGMEKREFFDLIFMDVQMPNLDGIQSTRLIRQMGYSAPIVALTAFSEESNQKECIDSGMDYFLPKPIRRPALKQVLKRYCPTIPEAEESEKTPEKEKSEKAIHTNGSLDMANNGIHNGDGHGIAPRTPPPFTNHVVDTSTNGFSNPSADHDAVSPLS